MNCVVCHKPHGKRYNAKYCEACRPSANKNYHPPKELRRVNSPKSNYKVSEYLGLNPDSHDWARLAAYIDGEGSIGLTPKTIGRGKSMVLYGRITVTNTDFRLISWLRDRFGMTYHEGRGNAEKWKPCFWAQAVGYRAAWISYNCLPWFLCKRVQAETLLEHQATMGTFVRGAGIPTPNNVLQFRSELRSRMHNLNKRGLREVAI